MVTLGALLGKLLVKAVGQKLTSAAIMEQLFTRQLSLRGMLADAGLPQLEELIIKNMDDIKGVFEFDQNATFGQIYETLTARYTPKDIFKTIQTYMGTKTEPNERWIGYIQAAAQWQGVVVKWVDIPADIRISAGGSEYNYRKARKKKRVGKWWYFFYHDNNGNFEFVRCSDIIRRLGGGDATYPARCSEFLKRIWGIRVKKDEEGKYVFWNKDYTDYRTSSETAEQRRKRMYGNRTEEQKTARTRAKLYGGSKKNDTGRT